MNKADGLVNMLGRGLNVATQVFGTALTDRDRQ